MLKIAKHACLVLMYIHISLAVFSQGKNYEAQLKYIEEYQEIAISEMKRAGIPASIKLAQAILESNSG